MSVFRETTISWDGKDYTFVPSMRLLRSIENEGVSILHVAHQVAQGKPQASLMAFIIAKVMQAAGARVSEEDIAGELMAGDAAKVMALYEQVLTAISPAPKKAAAPE